jgi:hypothetical protein
MLNTLPKLRLLAPAFLAALCLASPLGIFTGETDIAGTPNPGRTAFNSTSGEYSLNGAGGASDFGANGFHYVWKKVTGDLVIGTDTRFAPNGTAADRKAAVMVRQSLDPRSAYAAAVLRSDGLATLEYRVDTGAISKSTEVAANADMTRTLYLSLERHGDAFTVSAGKRGKMGGPIPLSAPVTVTMNGPVYVGLAVAGPESAIFSNLYLQAPGASAQ